MTTNYVAKICSSGYGKGWDVDRRSPETKFLAQRSFDGLRMSGKFELSTRSLPQGD